ncbi:hypothetical protein NPIL_42721 [Nephila pilipes]|uniref:RNase H type-1 domain-containing protein n=1 Tax=Nephila pilipes TaxID=299642 RepID=A0A8X6TGK7_NEPPI|nr:hypothetical protein NPIL_42721 [Nephila pilipes]
MDFPLEQLRVWEKVRRVIQVGHELTPGGLHTARWLATHALKHDISVYWIPSHAGVDGNEKKYVLTKRGSISHLPSDKALKHPET